MFAALFGCTSDHVDEFCDVSMPSISPEKPMKIHVQGDIVNPGNGFYLTSRDCSKVLLHLEGVPRNIGQLVNQQDLQLNSEHWPSVRGEYVVEIGGAKGHRPLGLLRSYFGIIRSSVIISKE